MDIIRSTLNVLTTYPKIFIAIIVILFIVWFWRRNKKEYPFLGIPSLARHEPLPMDEVLEAEKIIEIETKLALELEESKTRDAKSQLKKIRKQKNLSPQSPRSPMSPRSPEIDLETIFSPVSPQSPVLNHANTSKGFVSKGELILCKTLEDIYGVPFLRQRPDILKNPETGRNLEFDCYNKQIKKAGEYNGIQHRVYPNGLHKSREDFDKQQYRDEFKKQVAVDNQIKLVIIDDQVPFDEIPNRVRQQLGLL
jgi:hypothetical protein